MSLTCPTCHKEINQGDAFCLSCGTPLSSTKPILRAQRIKIYVLSFLLAPFGLYWFFKYRNENDLEKKLLASRVLWITVVAIIFMITSTILTLNTYNNLIDSYFTGYGF